MDIGKYNISLRIEDSTENQRGVLDASRIDEEYARLQARGKRLVLGTMAGRSGARWLCDIFSAHRNATGTNERNPGAESFWRYIKFNNLPIDTAGILCRIKEDVINDWKDHDVSLVFSPYFSHGLAELCDALGPERIIFAMTDPRRTVQSIYNKGLFVESYVRKNSTFTVGYQPELGDEWSHLFGRVIPSGDEYAFWTSLTRLGKIAWWADRITHDIHAQLQKLGRDAWIFDLQKADQNYAYYKDMAARFGLSPLLEEKEFLALKGKTVRRTDNEPHEWSAKEAEEFTALTKEWHSLYTALSPS